MKSRKFPNLNGLLQELDVKLTDLAGERAERARLDVPPQRTARAARARSVLAIAPVTPAAAALPRKVRRLMRPFAACMSRYLSSCDMVISLNFLFVFTY